MSIGKLESFLGKHIEGFFNKKFSSSLEFPEVAKQLQREVMHKKKKCRRGATVPNAYFIDMNNEDYQRMCVRRYKEELHTVVEKAVIENDSFMDNTLSIVMNSREDLKPEIVLSSKKACLRLPGTDGKAKMSKSIGNCIYLADDAKTLKTKIMSMYTDPNHIRIEDPGQVEGNSVFTYLDAFSTPEHFAEFLPEYQCLDELKEHYTRGGLGDVKIKKFLNKVMEAKFGPIRERRREWEQRIPEVYDILKAGTAVAEKKAAETLNKVKDAMKINYFSGDDRLA